MTDSSERSVPGVRRRPRTYAIAAALSIAAASALFFVNYGRQPASAGTREPTRAEAPDEPEEYGPTVRPLTCDSSDLILHSARRFGKLARGLEGRVVTELQRFGLSYAKRAIRAAEAYAADCKTPADMRRAQEFIDAAGSVLVEVRLDVGRYETCPAPPGQ